MEIEKSTLNLAKPKLFKILTSISIIALSSAVTHTILSYDKLPERVPMHLSFSGQFGNYQDDKAVIFLFIIIGIIVFLVTSLLSKIPSRLNYAVKITDENRERQYALASKFFKIISFEVALGLSYFQITLNKVLIAGIEIARKIREYDKTVKIIYATSYTDYLNMAFSVHAFGYLIKPVTDEQIYNQLNDVFSYLSQEKKDEEVLEFLTLEGVVRLKVNEIYYFEYLNRTVKLKTLDKNYIIKEKITSIANMMSKFGFVMPHKSFTVNMLHVKSIKGYDIFMMDGSMIPLSQKKSTEFRDAFNIFLDKHISK